MNPVFDISQTDPLALTFATENAQREGWNPGLDDCHTMIRADPQGFFLGRLKGEPIACASAVCYDEQFAFFGFYIVLPAYRGQGYGMQVTQRRLEYVGNRCVGLDGVVENEKMYQTIGFKRDFTSHRFEINRPPSPTSCSEIVAPYQASDSQALLQYDRKCFPATRSDFLQAWIDAPHAACFCAKDQAKFVGFVVIRRCDGAYKIGPLFADSRPIAQALLQSAMQSVLAKVVFIDVPECNPSACELVADLNAPSQFSCIRMYRHGRPDIDMSRVYGISSFELG